MIKQAKKVNMDRRKHHYIVHCEGAYPVLPDRRDCSSALRYAVTCCRQPFGGESSCIESERFMKSTVVTLTMNPSIDVSTRTKNITANRKLRCAAPRHEPRGGGINVAVAMEELGGKATAIFPCGGPPGESLQQLLQTHDIDFRTIPIKGWTRSNLAVYEEETEDQYRFLMPGPEMSSQEVQACLDQVDAVEPAPTYLIVSGRLPPGVPSAFMQKIADLAHTKQAKLIVDTSGEALQAAVDAGVYMLKPNINELCMLSGKRELSESEQEDALKRLIENKSCNVAVLSLGAAGVLLATQDQMVRLRAPSVPIQSRVGAGDSSIAGTVMGLCRGYEIADAVRYGVAAGSAAVMTPGSQLCRRKDVERLWHDLRRNQDAASH